MGDAAVLFEHPIELGTRDTSEGRELFLTEAGRRVVAPNDVLDPLAPRDIERFSAMAAFGIDATHDAGYNLS